MKRFVLVAAGVLAAGYVSYISFIVPAATISGMGYIQSLDTGLYVQKCMLSEVIMPEDYGFCGQIFFHKIRKHADNYCSMPAVEVTAAITKMDTRPGYACVLPKNDIQQVHRKLLQSNVHVPDFDQWWEAQ